MTATGWVRRHTPDPHTCPTPTRTEMITMPSMGLHYPPPAVEPQPFTFIDGHHGDLWRCPDCRKLWRVGRACDICDAYGHHTVGGCLVGNMWRPARTWQKLTVWIHNRTSSGGLT